MNTSGFEGGLVGVGGFFTLSGYLITTNLMRSYLEESTLRLGHNINLMLDGSDGYRVMWPTAVTGTPQDAYYDNANMQPFNEFLRQVDVERENLVIYDWASEVADHPDWFLEGDGSTTTR